MKYFLWESRWKVNYRRLPTLRKTVDTLFLSLSRSSQQHRVEQRSQLLSASKESLWKWKMWEPGRVDEKKRKKKVYKLNEETRERRFERPGRIYFHAPHAEENDDNFPFERSPRISMRSWEHKLNFNFSFFSSVYYIFFFMFFSYNNFVPFFILSLPDRVPLKLNSFIRHWEPALYSRISLEEAHEHHESQRRRKREINYDHRSPHYGSANQIKFNFHAHDRWVEWGEELWQSRKISIFFRFSDPSSSTFRLLMYAKRSQFWRDAGIIAFNCRFAWFLVGDKEVGLASLFHFIVRWWRWIKIEMFFF